MPISAEYRARLEEMGEELVRLKATTPPGLAYPFQYAALDWLAERDAAAGARNAASQAEMASAASRAATAAERAASAAEEQAREARRANTRATIALAIAIIGIAITCLSWFFPRGIPVP